MRMRRIQMNVPRMLIAIAVRVILVPVD
jgi:hypothetical protein